MTVPELPAIHHITVDGEDYLATNDGYRWERVGDGDSWEVGSKIVTGHGVVIPAGPVENLVRLPEVGEAVRDPGGYWAVDGKIVGGRGLRAAIARTSAAADLRRAARALAVARAIEAEQAKPPTARERLLAVADKHIGAGYPVAEVFVDDLRAALGEQP